MFDPVDPKQSFPKLEHGILSYWKEEHLFQRSLQARAGGERFSFYDGPPFATGLPHYGHLLAGTIKDVIPRYQTMRGKYVERRFGWDCHGLPIENLIEKEHDIKDKRAIEEMGIAAFNELCRASVQRYVKEWRQTVERTGRWVDMDWDYRTMDPEFMESIWWVFKNLWDKNLIYEGMKPMHICPRCATPLSNFEVTQGYKDRTDQSVIMTFPLVDDPDTIILAWTTTPWSLPGNMWLAVGPHITYAKVSCEGKTYIVAEPLVAKVFKGKEHEVTGTLTAKDLLGKRYEPLFPYFTNMVIPSTEKAGKPQTYGERVFRVIINDSVEVSDLDGTGIVHLTSSTGEDSNAVAVSEGVDVTPHLRIDGIFIEAVTDFAGMQAKPEGEDPMATDKTIIRNLKERGRHFSSFTVTHSYPHCWRCDTPLLPFTTGSWFVSIDKIKDSMLTANKQTEWVPSHLRDGRFGRWLEGARDWAISRNRYWGTPLPIWRCEETGDIEVIGSRQELMDRSLLRFTRVSAMRHGESEHNLIPVYQSKAPGSDLTKRGAKQADDAGEWLKDQKVAVIYCSPLARTIQTAEAVAKATGATVIVDERLREVDMGEYEGKTADFSDLKMMKAKRAHKLQTGSPENIYHFAGMETWGEVTSRVSAFLKDILPKHRSEHVLIVTHGDPMSAIKHFFTQEDPNKISQQPYPEYASPVSYYWDHEREQVLDLHKHIVDDVAWWGSQAGSGTLTIVRHGQTEWNKIGKLMGGEKNVPLNDEGRQQSEAAAELLAKNQYDVIVTSDLDRAVETAEILSKKLGIPVAEKLHQLRERDFGEWNGQQFEELQKKHPLPFKATNMSFNPAAPADGESLTTFLKRVQEGYDLLEKKYAGKRVILVTHSGVLRSLKALHQNLSYEEGGLMPIDNCETYEMPLGSRMKRIPEVLDCWFESGSMPYAQSHYPFEYRSLHREEGDETKMHSAKAGALPPGFPADFIAEGIDQTRGWFYTLTVLAAALYQKPAFQHCVVNGTVLAEDGRKMSKRLKNYPDPVELVEKHGADALRFTLMKSPAVRAEDLRFAEKTVEETVRGTLLPLWNSYAFFVTYANAAGYKPSGAKRHSNHPLDKYVRAEVQDLVSRMTKQLEAYDLSATCKELEETIDALTNWYIRLSRRRFAGKGAIDAAEAEADDNSASRDEGMLTLHESLVTFCQLLAPFCPFIADAIYLNLVPEEHGSVHLTDWPAERELTKEEQGLLARNRMLRRIVSLGLKVRSEKKVKTRQPLGRATVAVPPSLLGGQTFNDDDFALLRQELNVKEVALTDDPGSLGSKIVQVNARKVGPRLGGRVQEIIAAGKRGDFRVTDDGSILILDETLSPDEATVVYMGKEGEDVAAENGVVVSLDTRVTDALKAEGLARDLIRAVQKMRKDLGFSVTDRVTISIEGADDVISGFKALIEQETNTVLGDAKGDAQQVDLEETSVTIVLEKR